MKKKLSHSHSAGIAPRCLQKEEHMTTEVTRRETFHSKGWQSLVSMIMVATGCACFIFSCVAAMIIVNSDRKK